MILYSDESVDGVMRSSGCLYETPLSLGWWHEREMTVMSRVNQVLILNAHGAAGTASTRDSGRAFMRYSRNCSCRLPEARQPRAMSLELSHPSFA